MSGIHIPGTPFSPTNISLRSLTKAQTKEREAALRRLVTVGRDPRVDPVEGDAVSVSLPRCTPKDGWHTVLLARRVLSAWGSVVCYQATPRSLGIHSRTCSLRAWRRWAKGGQVVCRGES